MKLMTLGWMKLINHPHFGYYEWMYLKFYHKCLTDDWWILQYGRDWRALRLWHAIMVTLELDKKACLDLVLLLHSGAPGRTEANELLWDLMSDWALRPNYQDLSNKVSKEVKVRRRYLDRPPGWHDDRTWWCWDKYVTPRHLKWSPKAVPQPGTWGLAMGPGGLPMAPPDCWGPRQW